MVNTAIRQYDNTGSHAYYPYHRDSSAQLHLASPDFPEESSLVFLFPFSYQLLPLSSTPFLLFPPSTSSNSNLLVRSVHPFPDRHSLRRISHNCFLGVRIPPSFLRNLTPGHERLEGLAPPPRHKEKPTKKKKPIP
jgi:hypothetical protein